ncbi:hypothetical protein [Pseudanabaena yagii]|uniref:Glycosyltransferase family 1 protein n=1 Tax=Pseudanabaena yagii GIHE-NHR1 TaxID=2722753 RepID=A0ABX1LND9_9CYAN|nr:hypothetical protein [Pseudanabaena yagii]NMF56640.1 hypothetical protein [Pseudanabaena yagii GIHE-NHR1]
MKKILILSKEFDYSKMITQDAGPNYAFNMGWETDYLDNISLYQTSIIIIDNRINELECFKLEKYIGANKAMLFLLKVVDPCEEWCRNHYYYNFLFRIKDLINVFFLTTYIPQEVVKDLEISLKSKKMIFIPYPFNDNFNIKKGLDKRIKKILFSGNQDRFVYPYRYQFIKKVKFNPCLVNKISTLKHPGYPDINQKLVHDIIGNKYIEYLSKYIFMFISPSRCGLEFLKYSECAYARCVPVGKAPLSFSPKLKEFFLELNFDDLYRSIKYIFSIPLSDLEHISKNYYLTYLKERNPKLLNSLLDEFLDEVIK